MCRCGSLIVLLEEGEAVLIGLDSFHEDMEKVYVIKYGLKTT